MNRFASAILRAAEIREESFDHKAADKAGKELKYGYGDRFYQKDLHEAAREAAKETDLKPEMAQPIYLLLATAWNSILDWANEQLHK